MSKNFEAVSVPLPSDLPPLELTENARITLRERYLRKNEAGEVTETPEERFWAMSWDIASQEKPEAVEHWAREFYGMMAKGVFMPNSPAIMNSGKGNGNAYGACFTLPIDDSIDGIFTTVKNTALVQKAGGGTGFSFDRLRPTGDYISSSSGSTSGPMSFWKVLAEATNSIQQGCFIGSTLIGCPGENKAIKDIKKGDIVYSFDTVQGSMGYSRAACDAFLTKRGAEVWKLTTDKGLVLFATPDHLMLTRSGEYVPLSQLKKGQRLMPLSRYQKGSDIYVTLQDGKDTRMPEHRLLGKFLYPSYDPKQHDIHHKNGNHQDNHPDNLELMTTSQHHTHHGKLRGSFYEGGQHGDKNGMHRSNFWSTAPDDVKARYRHAIGKGAREDNVMKRPGAAAKHPLFNNEDTKLLAKRGKIVAAACMLKEKGLPVDRGSWPESVKSLYNTYRYKAETVERCFGSWDAFESELSFRNHVVVSTEYSHTEDVWDFEVEGTHNFCVVGQDGKGVVAHNSMRRGANMGMMTITHPDILKFIFAKQDLSAFTNYNVSVKMTDAWMASYKENPDGAHVVINQRNGKRFLIPKTVNKMTYAIQDLIPYEADHTEVKEGSVWTMREIFSVIVDCAWRTGEPGLFFIDAANRYNPTPHIGAYESTNPCVTGDTPILTDKGFFPIESLVGQKVNVWNGFEWSEVEPRVTGENQKLLKVTFSDGSELRCTPYHKFYIQNGQPRDKRDPIKKEAKELHEGDRLIPWSHPVISGAKTESRSDAYTRGFFCGDGSYHNEYDKNSLWLYGDKKNLLEHFSYRFANECSNDRTHVALDDSKGWSKTFVPGVDWDVGTRMDWLAGLIDSDGSVTSDGQVQIWSVNKNFLQEVKHALFISGTHSSLKLGKAAVTKLMPDGKGGKKEYHCQESWRLCIPLWGVEVLRENGLVCNRVDLSRVSHQKNFSIKVEAISEVEELADKVYCFTEEKRHMGTFACILTGNCGEQPLIPYESCNLGSINVAKFVKADKTFDYGALAAYVRTSCRFLDNVVDASPYPIPEIEHMCHTNRKIGLGIMGFADALFMMGLPYNSDEAIVFGGALMEAVHQESLNYSEALAEEKGVFPNYEGSLWEGDSVLGRARKMRNAVTTTVAPTGTISIFANCSGGVEPLFNLFFIRQVLNGKRLKELNEHFVKVAKERGFYSEGLLERIVTEGTLKNIAEVPEDVKRVFVCTRDIAPEWHIRMQAAFQKYCGSAISKTTNLPNDATREDVEKSYLMAWEMGCKGITVYRDGCRAEQPMSLKKEEKKVAAPAESTHTQAKRGVEDWKPRRPIKTPQLLSAVRIRQNTPLGNMHVTISVDMGTKHELEIFAQLGKAGDVASSDLEAICRTVSMYLRLGGSIVDVIEQFDGIGTTMSVPTKDGKVSSLADGLSKALQVYHKAKALYGLEDILLGKVDLSQISLKKGLPEASSPKTGPIPPAPKMEPVKPSGAGTCPSCKGKLIKSQGCMECPECGFSKCG